MKRYEVIQVQLNRKVIVEILQQHVLNAGHRIGTERPVRVLIQTGSQDDDSVVFCIPVQGPCEDRTNEATETTAPEAD